jgi:lysophospholipase L1-like esterase
MIVVAVVAVPLVAAIAGLAVTGVAINWGPFAFLHSWERDVSAIEDRYDPDGRSGEIVFYGASNFAQWTQLADDLRDYRVQNHAFGGSTDGDLLKFADRLLYPYNPAIVVLQTGSNDYVGMDGSVQERISGVVQRKRAMLELFHARLPNTHIVVMSGILMPGRSEFTPVVQGVNAALAATADELDYVTFIDAEALTWDGRSYKKPMFVADGIHLTREARRVWADQYIRPALEAAIDERHLEGVRR